MKTTSKRDPPYLGSSQLFDASHLSLRQHIVVNHQPGIMVDGLLVQGVDVKQWVMAFVLAGQLVGIGVDLIKCGQNQTYVVKFP